MKPQTIAIAGLLATTVGAFAGTSATISPVPVQPAASDDCSFEIAPYIWAASLNSSTSLPWNGPGGAPSSPKLDTKITGAFMLEAAARYRSFGLLADFNWLQLDTSTLRSGRLYSGADVQSDYIYSTGALTYTLPLCGDFHMDLLAGARLWHVSTDFDLKSGLLPGFQSNSSKTWVSPIIGTSMRYDLTSKWSLLGQVVWGGFDNSNTQWDAFSGVGYQFCDWCTGTLGYRYLSDEYEKNSYNLNVEAQGAQLGVRFTF